MRFGAHMRAKGDDAAAQARVDAIVASARAQEPVTLPRPLFRAPVVLPLDPSTDLLDRRLEEELAFCRRTLEGMGDKQCDDPILLSRHQVTLQSIDLLAQMLGHIAAVVGAADRADAVSRIGMIELRNRLTREHGDIAKLGFYRAASNPFSAQ
jgi:hypothetical protein